eukprot:RCo039852
MADDIPLFEETINELKAEFEKGLEDLRSLRGPQHAEVVTRLEASAKKMRKVLANYKYQVRSIKDPLQKATYDKKYREHDQDLANYEKELRSCKDTGSSSTGPTSAEPESPMYQTSDQVLCQAITIQDQSLAAVKRTQQMATACEVTGNEINVELRKQTERAAEVQERIHTLEGELKRAQREMVYFVRSAAGDKCFLLLVVLVVVAVVFIICWKIWGKNFSSSSSPSTPTPAVNATSAVANTLTAVLRPKR